MSIAITAAIVEGGAWKPAGIAAWFVKAFQRDPREGYAQGFGEFLQTAQDGPDFLRRIHGRSNKSGAAMRAGPIGVFPSTVDIIRPCFCPGCHHA